MCNRLFRTCYSFQDNETGISESSNTVFSTRISHILVVGAKIK